MDYWKDFFSNNKIGCLMWGNLYNISVKWIRIILNKAELSLANLKQNMVISSQMSKITTRHKAHQ